MIKSRRMRRVGFVARRLTGFWWGDVRERDHLEDSGVEGRIILKWIFNKWGGKHGVDLSGSG
jgi:hypothetical protein